MDTHGLQWAAQCELDIFRKKKIKKSEGTKTGKMTEAEQIFLVHQTAACYIPNAKEPIYSKKTLQMLPNFATIFQLYQ